MNRTQSAGAVIVNPQRQVVVVSQNYDSWSLPKGHIDPGEDALAAARREAREETGLTDLTLIRELGSYERYKIGADGVGEDRSELKIITLFLFTTETETLAPEDPANPEARWVALDEVASLLTHPKDKAFFETIKSSV